MKSAPDFDLKRMRSLWSWNSCSRHSLPEVEGCSSYARETLIEVLYAPSLVWGRSLPRGSHAARESCDGVRNPNTTGSRPQQPHGTDNTKPRELPGLADNTVQLVGCDGVLGWMLRLGPGGVGSALDVPLDVLA